MIFEQLLWGLLQFSSVPGARGRHSADPFAYHLASVQKLDRYLEKKKKKKF